MSSSSRGQEDVFPDLGQQWDLDRLYADLATAKQRPLTHTERACLRGLLSGINPNEIAVQLNRQLPGLRVDLTRGLYRYIEALTDVAVKNWREVATLLEPGYRRSLQPIAQPAGIGHTSPDHPADWGKAPDVLAFFGRTEELKQLEHWITGEHCRVVAVLGMGGMGKTNLSLKLAQGIQTQFECVIWRSLLNAPRLLDLLTDWLQVLSGPHALTGLPDLDTALSQLLQQLKTRRCLLILDNVETILQGGTVAGDYRDGYEDYHQLFQQLGAVSHQSCLLLTSRETPRAIAQLDGKRRPVRSLKLSGLAVADVQLIFAELGEFSATDWAWQQLVTLYNGNPLLLELVAKHIEDVFGGDIAAFLADGTPLFHDLNDLLRWHFDRLTPLEQEVMYWLAINREPVTIAELKEDVLSPTAKDQVSATLQSLQRRFPLERKANRFTHQPVVMEYLTNRFVKQMGDEMISLQLQYFNQYAFIKAQAKDYLRDSQTRVFIEAVLAHLQTRLHTKTAIVAQLQKVLQQLRQQVANLAGYGGGNLINLLHYLQVDLTEYDFSHLSIWQAYLVDTKLHRVNLTGANLAKSVFAETFGGISGVAFSRDGRQLATSDTGGEVQVRDGRTGQQQLTLRADTVWTWAVAFSPDGAILASAGDDYHVKLWDAQTGQCLQVLEGHTNTVNAIAFSPTSPLLASGGQDATIRLWAIDGQAVSNTTCVGILQGHQGRVWSLAFSPDGQTIVSGSEDCTLKQWDVRTGACLKTWTGHAQWVKSVAYSADGQWVASGSFDGVIKVWQVSTGRCLHTWSEHQSCVTAVTFGPTSAVAPGWPANLLASSSYDQTVKLWDVQTGRCRKTWQAHTNRIWCVAFSPDGQLLASGGEDHATRLWDVQTGYLAKTWKGHSNGILSLALNLTQTYLATGHEDQTVKLWHPETGEILNILRGHRNRVWSVAFVPPTAPAPSSDLLVSGSADRTLKLWNSRTGACLRTFEGHQSWVWSVAVSPTGDRLASGSYDRTIRLWNPHTGECLAHLTGHTAPVVCVAFSPDGHYLASSSLDTLIKLWHVPTGRCIQTLKGHEHSVWAVAFSPDGQQLASGSYDKTVKLWHLDSSQCIRTFKGHHSPVACLAFSPDGQQLASGSYDRTIRLWQVGSGQLLHTFCGHTKPIYALLFEAIATAKRSTTSQDAALIFSSSFDETVRVWEAKTGRNLKTWREQGPYEGMNITEVTGLTESQKATLLALGAIDVN